MVSKEKIQSIANSISEKFNISKIFLFGSYAYGAPEPDSDLDLCIIANFTGKRKIDYIREIRQELSIKFDIPFDILVYDVKEFEDRSMLPTTLEYKILKNGVLING